MANIVGEGFPSEIVSQIKQRQKVYGSINRTNQELTYLNARTGWCKLVSSVDVNTPPRGIQYTGTNLARKFILFNGTSNQVDKADLRQRYGVWPGTNEIGNDFYAYGMGGTNFGLNAMPGIISAEVRTETRGSLKTAEIKIKANNRNQFDIIDVLYMRLGFTLLLEWGNSSYFKNDGTYVADYTSLADNFLDGTLNYNNAFETIESKRKASCGNYDAIVGKVVNFQWSFLKDGTYDITVIVRSMGDVIESLKTNTLLPGAALDTAPSGSTEGETQTVEEGETPPEPTAEDVIKDFANTHEIGKFFYTMQQRMASLAPTTSGMSYLVSKGDGTIGFLKQKYEDEGGTQYYIRLGRFLSFIQTRLIPYVDNPDVKLLKIDINPETNLIYMLARQISTDPGVVIFNKTIPTPAGNVIFAEKGEVFEKEVNGNKYGKIMNAYFNMVYILTQMESLKDENGKVPLYDLLNCLCQGWNNATGNFNSLEPTVDSERNTIVFTDEVACPDRDDILKEQNKSTELAFFDVYGYYYTNEGASRAGFIRDISFTTTVSPNLASMITIGAQANGYVPGEDATAISAMNSGLTDRFKKKLDLEATKNNTTKGKNSLEESYQEQLAAYDTFIEELGSLNGETTPKWNPEAISAFTNAASSLFEYDQAKQTEEKKDTNPNAASPNRGFLPFDLSITMDGLSGMKVYQKYIIDTTYLPSNYPTSLEFLVKGVTNKIENNEWITVLESIAIPKSAQGSQVGQSAVSQASTPSGNRRDAARGTAPAGWPYYSDSDAVPRNIAAPSRGTPPTNTRKVSLSSKIQSEYLPAINKIAGYTKGTKLLATVMAQQEGFKEGSKSYRTNNPGNIGNTDNGKTKRYSTLKEGIIAQLDYVKNVAAGKASAYPLNQNKIIKPYYSPEIDKNQTNYQLTPYLPGYKFLPYTGTLEQFVKIYATGARGGNTYLSTILSYFKKNGYNITEKTTIAEIIKITGDTPIVA